MRKLILLALAIWGIKKLGEQLQAGGRMPFPTSSRPPDGYAE
jgi:hypothetical protein